MSGITIPGRIPTPLLSLLNYRRNYGVCIVKRGRPAQCRHAREKSMLVINVFSLRRRATNSLVLSVILFCVASLIFYNHFSLLMSHDNVKLMEARFALHKLRQSQLCRYTMNLRVKRSIKRKSRGTTKHRVCVVGLMYLGCERNIFLFCEL